MATIDVQGEEAAVRAPVALADKAVRACPARGERVDGVERLHLRADGSDAELVAQDQRRPTTLAVPAVGLELAATDPRSEDLHEDFSGPWPRQIALLEHHPARAAEDERLHVTSASAWLAAVSRTLRIDPTDK